MEDAPFEQRVGLVGSIRPHLNAARKKRGIENGDKALACQTPHIRGGPMPKEAYTGVSFPPIEAQHPWHCTEMPLARIKITV